MYNGHKSWAYWNVALWFANDEGLYNLVKDELRRSRTKDIAARRILEILGETKTPDGAKYSLAAIRAALVGFE